MSRSFLIVTLLKIPVVLFVLLTLLAYLVWLERKLAARIQSRWGPYRVGPHGLLQPLADLVKFIFKEDTAPAQVDRPIYFLAPFLAVALALMSIAVIPFGPQVEIAGQKTWMQITDLNIGLLFVLAVTSLGVYGVALAGWSSGSKYSLLGGLRSAAQMISYELAMGFAVVGVLILSGTLSLRGIVDAQSGYWLGFIPRWNILPQVIAFMVFIVAAFAETNRLPFDLPEAETELVAGFHTEYSSLKFAMFFTAEYAHMVTGSAVATILFFGGWLRPLPWDWLRYVPVVVLPGIAGAILWTVRHSYQRKVVERELRRTKAAILTTDPSSGRPFGLLVVTALALVLAGIGLGFLHDGFAAAAEPLFWFAAKVMVFLFFFIWVRWTLPRFRYDQLMSIGWKLLLPVAAANILITGLIVALRAEGYI